jgi:hypothetical protein
MAGVTDDPSDPALTRGPDEMPVDQADKYLVLNSTERAQGFIRPVRTSYIHEPCGSITTMGRPIAETYARQPGFYGSTYCVQCSMHRPVGAEGEFIWEDGTKVGT